MQYMVFCGHSLLLNTEVNEYPLENLIKTMNTFYKIYIDKICRLFKGFPDLLKLVAKIQVKNP